VVGRDARLLSSSFVVETKETLSVFYLLFIPRKPAGSLAKFPPPVGNGRTAAGCAGAVRGVSPPPPLCWRCHSLCDIELSAGRGPNIRSCRPFVLARSHSSALSRSRCSAFFRLDFFVVFNTAFLMD